MYMSNLRLSIWIKRIASELVTLYTVLIFDSGIGIVKSLN